ncbi:predicted protein [Postia placenta Mad-698-R]|nr:predicted protein [Postia placenta Mad-698-R]
MALPLRFVIFAMAASALCALLLAASLAQGPSAASRSVPPDTACAAERLVSTTTRGLFLAGYVAAAGLGAGVGAADEGGNSEGRKSEDRKDNGGKGNGGKGNGGKGGDGNDDGGDSENGEDAYGAAQKDAEEDASSTEGHRIVDTKERRAALRVMHIPSDAPSRFRNTCANLLTVKLLPERAEPTPPEIMYCEAAKRKPATALPITACHAAASEPAYSFIVLEHRKPNGDAGVVTLLRAAGCASTYDALGSIFGTVR